jgi:hypothetical protein
VPRPTPIDEARPWRRKGPFAAKERSLGDPQEFRYRVTETLGRRDKAVEDPAHVIRRRTGGAGNIELRNAPKGEHRLYRLRPCRPT